MVADWLLAMVPLVAAKVALVCPAATVTLVGTGKIVLLLLRPTITELAGALLSDTVQVVDALLVSVDGEQDRAVSCAGVPRFKVNVGAFAPVPAVTIAV